MKNRLKELYDRLPKYRVIDVDAALRQLTFVLAGTGPYRYEPKSTLPTVVWKG